MNVGFASSITARWFRTCLTVLLTSASFGISPRALAQQLAFRTYNQADGLTNAWASCLQQDPSGYILACTEHGLFTYDGRRFLNLGSLQGLPDGGFVHALTFDANHRIILRYSHAVFVSDGPITSETSPEALRFHVAKSTVGFIEDDERGQIVPWRDGAIFAAQGQLYYVRSNAPFSKPVIEPVEGMLRRPGVPLQDATPLASQGDTIWAARSDGELCGLRLLARRCFGVKDGLPKDNWAAFLVMENGHVLARSGSRLADIDTHSGQLVVTALPNQGGRYANYPHRLLLVRTPSGQVLTQSADGLMILEAGAWRTLSTTNGLPTVPILSVLFDHEKGLWLGVLGKGILRALGYGLWENLDHHDGLSNDVLWQMARQPDGPLWVANDEGVDAVGPPEGPRRHFDKPSFALVFDRSGHLWRSEGSSGAACTSMDTGVTQSFSMPAVNKILIGSGHWLWFLTERGLYFVEDSSRPSTPRSLSNVTGPVSAAVVAGDGSLWFVRRGRLVHRHVDGSVKTIDFSWSQPAFEPLTLAISKTGQIWAGGEGGGLYRLSLSNDRVLAFTQFEPPEIVSNTIVSILVDSRGWVWVGTDNGISVHDGARWVSANTDNGLIWDDLDQESLFEDTDGSMWFGTSQGLSHLLDPTRLFQPSVLQPVITSVALGHSSFRGQAASYSQDPLLVQFGVLNFQADDVVRFRYRLAGVDKDWAETASGYARYPSIPPGHHRFEVVAYDPLTHQVSKPVYVMLRMKQPWWLWWPVLVSYGLTFFGLAYAGLRLRFRILLKQRRMLQREVELQTREIRQAQAALHLLATQDSLTKLLTRGEIQSRLTLELARGDSTPHQTIALLDIDHFKRINDRYGHLAGDEILREMGSRLRLALRPSDYAGRYGGEELLIVLNDRGLVAMNQIERLNDTVCGPHFEVDGQVIRVTSSIGVAYADFHDDWKSLIGRADKALYRAKAQGRDRIIVWADLQAELPCDDSLLTVAAYVDAERIASH